MPQCDAPDDCDHHDHSEHSSSPELEAHTRARISKWLDNLECRRFPTSKESMQSNSFVLELEDWEDPTLINALQGPRWKNVLKNLGLVCFTFRKTEIHC